jgi:phage host-nuclease inhibitor protein Gam
MASIYAITDDYRQLLDMLDEGEVEPQMILDTLEGIDAEFEDKAENYAKIMKNMASDVEGLKAEIARLTARKRTLETNIDHMKTTLQSAMEATGKTKFKHGLFSFGIQKNPPSVSILCDVKDIPERFLRYKDPEADKKAILEEIKGGAEFDWAEVTQTERLAIR